MITVFPDQISALVSEIQDLYLSTSEPWIVGFSGGKDSSACAQLVWIAISSLPPEKRTKPVHIISTDTLVENPIVTSWLNKSHRAMDEHAARVGMPWTTHKLSPMLDETFWVCLIGHGYAAPRPKFRWCTERLKIHPSNAFIRSIAQTGGAILVLGIRKAESQARAQRMANKARLDKNENLPGTQVYSPIEDWTNDDVWCFLMQNQCPWLDQGNKILMAMYRAASADNECPIVVDGTTPSCGASRFGCWTCTMVEEDKSLGAMIENDPEREWMLPLLMFRDKLDTANDRHWRDFRRMTGLVQIHKGRTIPGPYTEESRHRWLRELLEAEKECKRLAPAEFKDLVLISDAELRMIRKIWIEDKFEFEDALPGIVKDVGRDVEFEALEFSLPPLDWMREAAADRFEYEFMRTVYGAVLSKQNVLKAIRRFQYRTESEAVATIAPQRVLFDAPTTGREYDAMVAAVEKIGTMPAWSAIWFVLGYLHGVKNIERRWGGKLYLDGYAMGSE